MNLIITGHTSGIGKYIYEKYGGVGLSRTTGFDITKDNISQYITPQTIFINNAFAFHDLDAQSNILDQAINASKIICIGTNSQWEGVYKDAKERLKQKCHKYFLEGKDITYLALGKVDTPYMQKLHPDDNFIDKEYLMNCIEFILNSKYRIEILSVRPD